MIGVTFFGLNLTPVFYVLLRRGLARQAAPRRRSQSGTLGGPEVEVQSVAGNGEGAGVGTSLEL